MSRGKPTTKLTVQDILDIRAYVRLGASMTFIAETFKISLPTLSFIVRGKAWKHVVGYNVNLKAPENMPLRKKGSLI